ncbi:50S ribosomal protein L28 [Candidatus Margulisiibacteriota bacterium]
MSKQCEICGKKPLSGNNVSHSKRRTKRRWLPNLHNISLCIKGVSRKYKICASCLKTHMKKAVA